MNAIQKISKRAKQLQKSKPRTPWAQLIKQASREYRAGKLGATLIIEKKETARTKPKKVVKVTRTKSGQFRAVKRVGSHSAYGNTNKDFWVNMFACRSRSWQNQTYREVKEQIKREAGSSIESRQSLIAQLRALEYILNRKPMQIK